MNKFPAPGGYKTVPEDALAVDATMEGETLQGPEEPCQMPGTFGLEQLKLTETAPYEYLRLDRSRMEIRLLTLEPGFGSDVIRCTLKHAFLDVTPTPLYETTSYVCGPPIFKSTILLHGREVQTMSTSEAALRRMRLQDKPRTLWIDSICIDQNDTDERGHQVGMMYQIYSETFRNLIYLGLYDDTIADVIVAMEAIMQEIARETRDYADFQKLLFHSNDFDRFSKTPLSNPANCPTFLRLVDNPWFSRLWVVQEVSLALTNVCHYGDFEVSLTDVVRSARWLHHKCFQMPRC